MTTPVYRHSLHDPPDESPSDEVSLFDVVLDAAFWFRKITFGFIEDAIFWIGCLGLLGVRYRPTNKKDMDSEGSIEDSFVVKMKLFHMFALSISTWKNNHELDIIMRQTSDDDIIMFWGSSERPQSNTVPLRRTDPYLAHYLSLISYKLISSFLPTKNYEYPDYLMYTYLYMIPVYVSTLKQWCPVRIRRKSNRAEMMRWQKTEQIKRKRHRRMPSIKHQDDMIYIMIGPATSPLSERVRYTIMSTLL